MPRIYKQSEAKTLILCDSCLDELGPLPGRWDEEPLMECSVCGAIDDQSREEMDAYHHHMSNLQYEDYAQGQYDNAPNPYHGTLSEE